MHALHFESPNGAKDLTEQRLAADVLDQVTRSANDEVAEYRRQMREYR